MSNISEVWHNPYDGLSTKDLAYTPSNLDPRDFFLGGGYEIIHKWIACWLRRRSRSENRCCRRQDQWDTRNLCENMAIIHSPLGILQCHTWAAFLICYFESFLMLINAFMQRNFHYFFVFSQFEIQPCHCTLHFSVTQSLMWLWVPNKYNPPLRIITLLIL